MSLSMHAITAPVFDRMLYNMLAWLDRAEAHATQRKFDAASFLSMKLAPDMLPLVRQVQIATDSCKGCMARLAGVEIPSWPDDEATMDDVRARVRKAIAYVATFTSTQIDAGESRAITVPMRNRDPLQFVGADYVRAWAMPNFYFHTTATYMLLRHAGVELGKSDFLGSR